jgi:uncharacterized membrane protein
MNKEKPFLKREAIKFGWEIVTKDIVFFFKIMCFFAIGSFLMNLSLYRLVDISGLAGWTLYLLSLSFLVLIGIGFIKISLKVYDKEKTDISDLFNNSKYFLKVFLAGLIYALMIFIGIALLVIPGIILAVKYMFYEYYIIDKNCGVIEAFRKSSALTKGKKWHLYLFVLVAFAFNALGLLFFLVGIFITIPITRMAVTYIYRELSKEEKEQT